MESIGSNINGFVLCSAYFWIALSISFILAGSFQRTFHRKSCACNHITTNHSVMYDADDLKYEKCMSFSHLTIYYPSLYVRVVLLYRKVYSLPACCMLHFLPSIFIFSFFIWNIANCV